MSPLGGDSFFSFFVFFWRNPERAPRLSWSLQFVDPAGFAEMRFNLPEMKFGKQEMGFHLPEIRF